MSCTFIIETRKCFLNDPVSEVYSYSKPKSFFCFFLHLHNNNYKWVIVLHAVVTQVNGKRLNILKQRRDL